MCQPATGVKDRAQRADKFLQAGGILRQEGPSALDEQPHHPEQPGFALQDGQTMMRVR
jgi:hypothetical protein